MTKYASTALSVALAGLLPAALAAQEEGTLRLATWDDEESLEIIESIAAAFEAAHPGTDVQIEAYGDGYDTKLSAAMGAGNAPDVMYMWNFPAYAASLMPLNDFIERDGAEMDIDDISPALLDVSRIDGNVYGMPAGFTTHVIFYNRDLLEEAGVAEPEAGWTWSDLREKAAAASDPENQVYGFAVDARPDPYDFEQFYWSNGTQFISDDGTEIDGYMNSPEGAEVLNMFADMIASGEAVALNIGDDVSGSALFRGGNLAMFEGAMWNKGGIDESGIDYGIVGLPAFEGKPVKSAINSSAVSISADTDNPELAWDFVKFFSSPEAVAMRVNDLPVRASVAAETGQADDPMLAPFFEMLEVSEGTSPAFLKHEDWARMQENLSAAIEATMIEGGNAQAHLDDAVRRSARFLR
ncbi:putative sugar uptake ABC transporter periplasmic solute-binding protein precursor [Oceanicola granulosus HTCC2516]|uniref:Putative sugar uptake ABC transporter periplasmic solute-binding protein n=1 Tax=Oceanicola granulosus (strain ATCC BAA-861 / DSM 15982 / KCTC 12143 / HTCC2516) TaxID=314256 RepID=Q2CGD4_OCEGH|nr:sugar ABC transporter substrate-binding protein [Oceanicola granulosus]EAR51784.1 putative sugar uptake ABC transporter periplasmic solute-binding protein precursor [Oceanicola granulosus HTCC2516]